MTGGWIVAISLAMYMTPLCGGSQKASLAECVREVARGKEKTLSICGKELAELPAEVDVNPLRTQSDELKKATGFPLKTKEVALCISQRRCEDRVCVVKLTPYFTENGKAGILVRTVRMNAEGNAEESAWEKRLEPANDLGVVVIGKDGKEQAWPPTEAWAVMVALDKGMGVLAWSTEGGDEVIEPHKGGYRRF